MKKLLTLALLSTSILIITGCDFDRTSHNDKVIASLNRDFSQESATIDYHAKFDILMPNSNWKHNFTSHRPSGPYGLIGRNEVDYYSLKDDQERAVSFSYPSNEMKENFDLDIPKDSFITSDTLDIRESDLSDKFTYKVIIIKPNAQNYKDTIEVSFYKDGTINLQPLNPEPINDQDLEDFQTIINGFSWRD